MPYVLSKHFALPEFTYSSTAEKNHIDNTPPEDSLPLAEEFCTLILDPIRERFGVTVITSGFRCPELNTLVHGVPTSDHQWTNEHVAADFQTPQADLDEVFNWLCKESKLPFDQVIREHGSGGGGDCIHISYALKNRREALLGATHNQSPYTKIEVV